jgi:hypothetical protein
MATAMGPREGTAVGRDAIFGCLEILKLKFCLEGRLGLGLSHL